MSRYVFEDFVPFSDTEALITSGRALNALTEIERTEYRVNDAGVVVLGRRVRSLASGNHLRLGGFFNWRLIYSDHFKVKGAEAPEGAHQPFLHEGALYYTAEWPLVCIHRDGKRYRDHFGDMVQVGNAHWSGDTMYFEARADPSPTATDAWQIWKQKDGGEPEFVTQGANPACYDGWLYFGKWNGKLFDYHRMPL